MGPYIEAIRSIDRHAVEIDPDAARGLREGLRSLQNSLASLNPTEAILEERAALLDGLLKTYSSSTVACYTRRESEVRDIIAMVGAAAEALGYQSEAQRSQLSGLANELQSAARLENLSDIKRVLTRQVTELRSATAKIYAESHTALLTMQKQLNGFQERLEHAERLASIDELTGLLNRREGEARVRRRISQAQPFCLLVLDLNRFKSINDQHGHGVGDEVLRIFAKKLSSLVRPGDLVSRWGGDEFVVTIDFCGEATKERARQIASSLAGKYTLTLVTPPLELYVSAAMGMATLTDGDTLERLFARADAALYEHKKESYRLRAVHRPNSA